MILIRYNNIFGEIKLARVHCVEEVYEMNLNELRLHNEFVRQQAPKICNFINNIKDENL